MAIYSDLGIMLTELPCRSRKRSVTTLGNRTAKLFPHFWTLVDIHAVYIQSIDRVNPPSNGLWLRSHVAAEAEGNNGDDYRNQDGVAELGDERTPCRPEELVK